jgi:Ca2+-binding EF-hand superfamily protein
MICGLSVLTLTLGAAKAQDGDRKGPPGGEGGGRLGEFMKRADTNNDGKISKDEFLAMSKAEAEERFSKVDANGDGSVDQSELASAGERMREGMRNRGGGGEGGFRRPGGDRPGGEGGSGFRRPPGEGDKPNPEGDRPKPPGGDRPEGGRPEGRRPEGDRPTAGGPQGGPMIDEIFGRMDKNSDGNVDKDEYAEFSKQEIEQRFGRMDENSDGKVSKDEMRNAMERMRGMMRGGPGGPGGPGGFRGPGGEGPGSGGGFRRPPGGEGESPRPPKDGA